MATMMQLGNMHRIYRRLLLFATAGALLLLLLNPFFWQLRPTQIHILWFSTILLLLLAIDANLSRYRHRRKIQSLKDYRRDLEIRVSERTNRLRKINNQLYDEIAKQELTEVLLRETQDYLRSILNSMPSILIGVTREGTITHWNTAAQKATGTATDIALRQELLKIYPEIPVTLELIREAIDSGIPQIRENIAHDVGNEQGYVNLTVYPLISEEMTGAVIRLDDVTLRVRMETMMIQNEKMMSLGELAAGMAHEINNPLSAILNGIQNIHRRTSTELAQNKTVAKELGSSIELIREYLTKREIYTFLDGIREAGERAANIVKNMLEFSRYGPLDHQSVDIVELLEHSLELAANSFELTHHEGLTALRIEREFATDVPLVLCSPTEMQQVFLNILRNACQAIEADTSICKRRRPQITLRTYADSACVFVEIEDNGPGMDQRTSRHIFEPFFTTKETGEGTGLGLSISYFIVTEHHEGTIDVDSKPDHGTRFVISLPRAEHFS